MHQDFIEPLNFFYYFSFEYVEWFIYTFILLYHLSSERSSHIFNQLQSLEPCDNLVLQIALKSFILPSLTFNSNSRLCTAHQLGKAQFKSISLCFRHCYYLCLPCYQFLNVAIVNSCLLLLVISSNEFLNTSVADKDVSHIEKCIPN